MFPKREGVVGSCLPLLLGRSQQRSFWQHLGFTDGKDSEEVKLTTLFGWWFEIFFIFTPTWGDDPI